MNKTKETIFTAYIGIDWADKKHDNCCILSVSFILNGYLKKGAVIVNCCYHHTS